MDLRLFACHNCTLVFFTIPHPLPPSCTPCLQAFLFINFCRMHIMGYITLTQCAKAIRPATAAVGLRTTVPDGLCAPGVVMSSTTKDSFIPLCMQLHTLSAFLDSLPLVMNRGRQPVSAACTTDGKKKLPLLKC